MNDNPATGHDGAASVYGPSYFAATAVTPPQRPPLAHDLDVEVCVIGAGLAGLTAAREIARRGWSVAVLETRCVGWGASGRNSGFVLPGFAQAPRRIVERSGLERARVLWRMAQAGLDYVRATIAETQMPGVELTDGGWLSVSKVDIAREVADETEFMRATFGADVEMWPTEKLRAHLKTAHYFQAMHYRDAFHIHPLNYTLGLALAAEQAGARIFEDTPALSIDPVGVRKRVTTPQGRVRAAHVLVAGNVHIGAAMPQIAGTLVPVTTYVIATAPLGDGVRSAIDFAGSVSDTDWADNHYRLAGDRLIWSGRLTVHEADPRRYARRLRRDIARLYPQLDKVEIEYAWSGTLGNSVHRMPQVGEISPGLWIASGFGGHGLNTTAMAGNLIARGIVEGNAGWHYFDPFELVWAGGWAGRVAAKLGYVMQSTAERLTARIARRREIRRARKEVTDACLAEATWNRVNETPVAEPVPSPAATEPAPGKERKRKSRGSSGAKTAPAVDETTSA